MAVARAGALAELVVEAVVSVAVAVVANVTPRIQSFDSSLFAASLRIQNV